MESKLANKEIAAVFPGQGSQSIGMGKELYENFQIYRDTLEEASDSVGVDFKKLCFEGPESDLQLTENTQPAIVTCSVGAFKVLASEFGFKPHFVAGHSVGEYAALVSAGVISFSDAVKGVKLRGQSMQEAVPLGEGAMAALLGPSDEQAVDLCKWVETEGQKLGHRWSYEAANFNCPGQVVVSGNAKAQSWLKENLPSYNFDPKPKKVRLLPLKVSAPFHCNLMKPAEEKMGLFLNGIKFSSPKHTIIQNVTAKASSHPDEMRENLTKQISGSVLWSKSVHGILSSGVTSYVEIGSGSTLLGLIKKISAGIDSPNLSLFNTTKLEDVKTFGNFLQV